VIRLVGEGEGDGQWLGRCLWRRCWVVHCEVDSRCFCAEKVDELNFIDRSSRYMARNISYLRTRGSPAEETCK